MLTRYGSQNKLFLPYAMKIEVRKNPLYFSTLVFMDFVTIF